MVTGGVGSRVLHGSMPCQAAVFLQREEVDQSILKGMREREEKEGGREIHREGDREGGREGGSKGERGERS